MTDDSLADPETFYDAYGHREWERLDGSLHGRIEWEGTVERLAAHLPDPDALESGHVLDAGGGAGRYSIWLADRGFDVTLVDLSAEQLAIAREKVAEAALGERVTTRKGDVRDLPFDDGAFDATLCLGGPLSHVMDAGEREGAVAELRRVTSPGGPVFVSVLGRLSLLQIMLAAQVGLEVLPEIAATGDYTPDVLDDNTVERGFTSTHFFRADEFESLLEAGGLDVRELVGLEGVASGYAERSLREAADDLDGDQREHVRELVEQLRDDRVVADLSAHVLAVCTA